MFVGMSNGHASLPNAVLSSWPSSAHLKLSLDPIAEEPPVRDLDTWSMPAPGKATPKGRMGQPHSKPPLLAMFLSLCMGVFLSGFLFSCKWIQCGTPPQCIKFGSCILLVFRNMTKLL
jgi:hypothetical protein